MARGKPADATDAGAEDAAPRRRADAARNHAAIVEAALALFSRHPEATMAEVAAAAGVGRVTLYAHFPSRQALLLAVVDRAIAETVAQPVDDPPPGAPAGAAVTSFVHSSWQALNRFGRLSAMVQRELDPEQLREHHAPALDRMTDLIERGQADASIRTDLPASWLVTAVYALVHAAADEVDQGRLAADDAPDVLVATLGRALAPPG